MNHTKALIERHLVEVGQPYLALRAGAFLDQTNDPNPEELKKGVYRELVPGARFGMVFTGDLARYLAQAAVEVPDSALNQSVDIGWSTAATGEALGAAFTKVLARPIAVKPAYPAFAVSVVLPLVGLFNSGAKDMSSMIRFMRTGVYVSHNTQKQKDLFGDLYTVEQVVERYCRANALIG